MYIVDCSHAQSVKSIYLNEMIIYVEYDISRKDGMCISSRGILGVYPCHDPLILCLLRLAAPAVRYSV